MLATEVSTKRLKPRVRIRDGLRELLKRGGGGDAFSRDDASVMSSGSEVNASGSEVNASGSEVNTSGSEVSTSGSDVNVSGCEVNASGSGVNDSGSEVNCWGLGAVCDDASGVATSANAAATEFLNSSMALVPSAQCDNIAMNAVSDHVVWLCTLCT